MQIKFMHLIGALMDKKLQLEEKIGKLKFGFIDYDIYKIFKYTFKIYVEVFKYGEGLSIAVLSQLLSKFANFSCIDSFSSSATLFDSFLVPVDSSLFTLGFELLNEALFAPSDLR